MSYEYNLEYEKGGRISPEISAMKPLVGTLGLGLNGNIWVNKTDKNGRLSWKPTLLADTFKRAYPFIQFLEYPIKNTVYFKIVDKNFIFKFEYVYDEDSNYTLGYFNSDVAIVKRDKFNFLVKSFFEDLSQEEYNRLNPDAEYTYNEIKEGVNNLFVILKNMIDEKVLRSSKNEETPDKPNPKFKIGDKVKIPKALISDVNVTNSNFDNNKKQWFYEVKNLKRGVTHFGIAEDELDFDIEETPQPKFKIGDKVKPKGETSKLTVLNPIFKDNEWSYEVQTQKKEIRYFISEDNLEFDIEEEPDKTQPKFKIGDKVIIINSGRELATVINIFNDNERTPSDTEIRPFYYDVKLEDGQEVSFFENQLELYEKPPFQQIDFTKPSTEELETVIRAIQYNSDEVTFINGTLAGVSINLKDRVLYVDVLFDQVNNLIKLYADGLKCWSNEIQPKITNETLEEISLLYYKTLVLLLEKVEKDKDTEDCEADASLIVSEQVKKFYDLNKTRIEKLNANISCKIIKALVSLSDYEKCGLPSKSKIQLPKDNLLSEIQNLKF